MRHTTQEGAMDRLRRSAIVKGIPRCRHCTDMPSKPQRAVVLSAVLVAFVTTTALSLVGREAAPAPASPPALLAGSTKPPLRWTPDHVTVTLTPGETKELAVTVNASSNVPATGAQVVPSLAPYVSVFPGAGTAMTRGSQATFNLSVSVASGTPFQTIEGTLHLRSGSETIARPLPMTLNVWPSYSDPLAGYSLNYPPSLHAQQPTVAKTVFGERPEDLEGDTPASIEIFVLPVPMSQVLDRLRSIIADAYSEETLIVDSAPAMRITGVLDANIFGWGGRRHGYVLFAHNEETFQLQYDTEDPAVVATVNDMLTTFRFSEPF